MGNLHAFADLAVLSVAERSLLIRHAAAFAEHSHAGTVRTGSLEPYFEHSREVAGLVALVDEREEVIAAAYLHDVPEDVPGVTIGGLAARFGTSVARLVDQVTNPSRPEDGSRARRKAIDLAHRCKASRAGQNITLADVVSNMNRIENLPPAFARIYLEEKRRVVVAMTRGHPLLRAGAAAALDVAARRLSLSVS